MSSHILLFTDDPEGGGVAQYHHAISCALVQRGYRVTCVQSRVATPLIQQQSDLGVQHVWLPFHTLHESTRTLTDSGGASAIFQNLKPDLVCFNNCWPLSHLAAKREALQAGIPYLIVEGVATAAFVNLLGSNRDEVAHQYRQAREVIAVSYETLRVLRSKTVAVAVLPCAACAKTCRCPSRSPPWAARVRLPK